MSREELSGQFALWTAVQQAAGNMLRGTNDEEFASALGALYDAVNELASLDVETAKDISERIRSVPSGSTAPEYRGVIEIAEYIAGISKLRITLCGLLPDNLY